LNAELLKKQIEDERNQKRMSLQNKLEENRIIRDSYERAVKEEEMLAKALKHQK
jgi:hypothetical protein